MCRLVSGSVAVGQVVVNFCRNNERVRVGEAMAETVTLADIVAARERIADGIYCSPCPESRQLTPLCGTRVFCKLDYLQRTGSFKERGARNALLLLDEGERRRGVVAASAGNHALGLAYHGQLLGIGVTVVMPRFAPLIKAATCRNLGANVILCGDTFAEARAKVQELVKEKALVHVHGFDNAAIIAGQGTLGLEIMEQVPDVEAVVVPVGGGGLIAGIATAVKSRRHDVRIIGVEAEATPNLTSAIASGKPVAYQTRPTLADGLSVGKIGAMPFDIVRNLVDEVLQVSEDEIALAILRLVELEKSVVEGAAATPLAACMRGLKSIGGRRTVLVLCGGNIDLAMLGRVIEHGLVLDGRLCRFTATISDRPGGLARLSQIIASAGASVREIDHDRAFAGPDFSAVNVLCTVETSDKRQIDELVNQLTAAGIRVARSGA